MRCIVPHTPLENEYGTKANAPFFNPWPCSVSPPEILEPCRRQFRVAHGVLDVPVSEVGLKSSRVVPFIGQGVTARVSEHVWVGLEP